MLKLRARDFISGMFVGAILFSGIAYASTSISVDFLPIKFYFEGVQKQPPPDQQGFIYNGRTYVPLSFLAESLGKKVSWNGTTNSIYIGTSSEANPTANIVNSGQQAELLVIKSLADSGINVNMMGWTVKFDHMSSDGRYVVHVYVDHSGGMTMDTPMTTPMTMTEAWYYVSPLTGSIEYKLEY